MPVNVAQNVEKAKEIYHDDSFLAKIEVLDSFLFNHFSEALIIDAEILQYLLRPAKGRYTHRVAIFNQRQNISSSITFQGHFG